MTKDEFQSLFESALESTATYADHELGWRTPRIFRILLYGGGSPGRYVTPEAAVDTLYLGDDRFHRIIDIAVVEVGNEVTTCFVRASDHTPGPFDQTWNSPPGSGPFKQLLADDIGVTQE